jgi:hypothetical protein
MRGRTPGGEAAWRIPTPAEQRAYKIHEDRVHAENSKRAHAVCHHHGAVKRDGTPRAFIEDDKGEECPAGSRQFDDKGVLLCRPFWQSVPCPMGTGCLHR